MQKATSVFLPKSILNVFAQVRNQEDFVQDELRELSDNIGEIGLLHPLTVACFDKAEAMAYISIVNKIWDTDHNLEKMKVERGKYFILLAGERRYRAIELMSNKKFRHVFPEGIECRVITGISALRAAQIQLSENTHKRPPLHREAQMFTRLFRLARIENSKISISSFARACGTSAQKMRKSFQFCELPEYVQKEVERGILSFGHALEISRLQKAQIPDDSISWWTLQAMISRDNMATFRQKITHYLEEKDQPNLFQLIVDEVTRRNHVKQTVGTNIIRAVHENMAYFRKVLRLLENGSLGKEDSPFSIKSPREALVKEVEVLRLILPHMRSVLGDRKVAEMHEVFDELQAVMR